MQLSMGGVIWQTEYNLTCTDGEAMDGTHSEKNIQILYLSSTELTSATST